MATLSCPYCPIPKKFIPSDINYILCKFHLHHTDKEVGCSCKYCVSKKIVDNEDIPSKGIELLKLHQLQSQLYIKKECTEEIESLRSGLEEIESLRSGLEEIESLSSGLEIINISQSDKHSDGQSSNEDSNEDSNESEVNSDMSVNNDSNNEIIFVQSPMESFIKLNYLDE